MESLNVKGNDLNGKVVIIDADDDEPVLILKARNPAAAIAARAYAEALEAIGEPREAVEEHEEFAELMERWKPSSTKVSTHSKLASDCYRKADPNEPIFVLRGQDKLAPEVVREWVRLAEKVGCPPPKLNKARAVADAMDQWPVRKFPD